MKRSNKLFIAFASLITLIFIATTISNTLVAKVEADNRAHLKAQEAEKLEAEKKVLEQQKSELETENIKDDEQIKLKDERIKTLENEVQARAKAKATLAASRTVKPTTQPVLKPQAPKRMVGTINCGDNEYKQFIYRKESGCNTAAMNAGGCFGIGQACPGSKVSYCGTDFACQDAWFSNYAQTRYGGWAGAYSAWLRQGWW